MVALNNAEARLAAAQGEEEVALLLSLSRQVVPLPSSSPPPPVVILWRPAMYVRLAGAEGDDAGGRWRSRAVPLRWRCGASLRWMWQRRGRGRRCGAGQCARASWRRMKRRRRGRCGCPTCGTRCSYRCLGPRQCFIVCCVVTALHAGVLHGASRTDLRRSLRARISGRILRSAPSCRHDCTLRAGGGMGCGWGSQKSLAPLPRLAVAEDADFESNFMEPVRALAAATSTAPPLPPRSASNGSSGGGSGSDRVDCGGASSRAPCPVNLLVPPQAAVVVVTGPNTGGAPPHPLHSAPTAPQPTTVGDILSQGSGHWRQC